MSRGFNIRTTSDGVPIFHTPKAFESPSKLLVLTSGTGRVKPGLCSVSVVASYGLKEGTWKHIILNPNDSLNSSPNGRFQNIRGKMCYHTAAVFCDLIIPSNPEKVLMIGHSAGREFTLSVIKEFTEWIIEHMKAFALTDGIESSGNEIQSKWGREHGVNWVQSDEHVNTPLGEGPMTMHKSVECRNHILCTYTCFICL